MEAAKKIQMVGTYPYEEASFCESTPPYDKESAAAVCFTDGTDK